MALAAAVAFTGRKKILVFRKGYHGSTLYFPSTLSNVNINLPHDFVIAPYNDIPGTRAIIEALPSESLAAILVEPIQGNGGCIVGSKEFLHYLDVTAHKIDAAFIVDEVMTSRLSYHGLSSELGLKPDLITLGRWVGGGMTFGAFGGRRDGGIMSLLDPRNGVLSHSGTFNNNIVTMAAGCAGLELYNEWVVHRLNALGESLKSGVEGVLKKHGINQNSCTDRCPKLNEDESPFTGVSSEHLSNSISVESLSLRESKAAMWISGQGSMLNVHFSGESEKNLRSLFWHHMLEQGIYLAQRGFIALHMELFDQHIEKFIHGVDSFVSKYRIALAS